MIETISPPTDNLYKFLAIGGLTLTLVAIVFLFRDQARLRGVYTDAQVELLAGGYIEGSGPPADQDLRRAYFRRQAAEHEVKGLLRLIDSPFGSVMGISLSVSIVAFLLWWFRVQRYDDEILRVTTEKLRREERAAA